jgi:hypothetical protein
MDNTSDQLVIREFPITIWIFGLLDLAVGAYLYFTAPTQWIALLILAALFLLVFAFASILVVKADRAASTLTISRISLFRRYARQIPISDIAAIQLESSSSQDSTSTYRIVVITKGNEIVPFRSSYSSGSWSKEAKVKRLREFLGVGGA